MWSLKEVKDTGFVFVHKPFFEAEEETTVALEDLKQWKKYKGAAPVLCEAEEAKKLVVQNSAFFKSEMHKYLVQSSLLEAVNKNGIDETMLAFTTGPTGVWAKKNLRAKQLKLYPSGTVSKVKDGKIQGKVVATFEGSSFTVSSYRVNTDFAEDKDVLDAFFWVKSNEDEDMVNMQMATANDHLGVVLPYLTNSKAIKAGEQLLALSPKVETSVGSEPAAEKAKKQ